MEKLSELAALINFLKKNCRSGHISQDKCHKVLAELVRAYSAAGFDLNEADPVFEPILGQATHQRKTSYAK